MVSCRLLLVYVAAGLALAGCAHDPGPPPDVDLAALRCAAAPDLAHTTPLPFDPKKDTSVTLTIDGAAGCIEADGSRSLYRVFALPDTGAPYILAVSAQQWGNTILAPRVTLLDGSGNILRRARHTDFAFRASGLTAMFRSHSDERFLMVASDPEFAGRNLSRIVTATQQTTAAAGPVIVTVYTGSDTVSDLMLLPAGTVTVSLSAAPEK